MSLEQMDAKAKRNYFEAWRDSVETVSAVFELGGRMPAEERSADGKVRPVAMRPIPLPELRSSVAEMVEEIAGAKNAWDTDAIHVEDFPREVQSGKDSALHGVEIHFVHFDASAGDKFFFERCLSLNIVRVVQ